MDAVSSCFSSVSQPWMACSQGAPALRSATASVSASSYSSRPVSNRYHVVVSPVPAHCDLDSIVRAICQQVPNFHFRACCANRDGSLTFSFDSSVQASALLRSHVTLCGTRLSARLLQTTSTVRPSAPVQQIVQHQQHRLQSQAHAMQQADPFKVLLRDIPPEAKIQHVLGAIRKQYGEYKLEEKAQILPDNTCMLNFQCTDMAQKLLVGGVEVFLTSVAAHPLLDTTRLPQSSPVVLRRLPEHASAQDLAEALRVRFGALAVPQRLEIAADGSCLLVFRSRAVAARVARHGVSVVGQRLVAHAPALHHAHAHAQVPVHAVHAMPATNAHLAPHAACQQVLHQQQLITMHPAHQAQLARPAAPVAACCVAATDDWGRELPPLPPQRQLGAGSALVDRFRILILNVPRCVQVKNILGAIKAQYGYVKVRGKVEITENRACTVELPCSDLAARIIQRGLRVFNHELQVTTCPLLSLPANSNPVHSSSPSLAPAHTSAAEEESASKGEDRDSSDLCWEGLFSGVARSETSDDLLQEGFTLIQLDAF